MRIFSSAFFIKAADYISLLRVLDGSLPRYLGRGDITHFTAGILRRNAHVVRQVDTLCVHIRETKNEEKEEEGWGVKEIINQGRPC